MAQYTTSEDAMARGAVAVDSAAEQIQGHITSLRSEVDTMMGGWRGPAAASFVAVHEAFEQHAKAINTALRHIHDSLVTTQRAYGNQESEQARVLSGLAGRING